MYKENLEKLNLMIPEAPKPLAAYVPAVLSGNVVHTSGQLPMVNGTLAYTGKVGSDVSKEDGKAAARVCAINCLSAVLSVVPDIESIQQVVKLTVFVNSASGFTDQPEVANGASQLLLDVFGDAGKHARSAVGVAELPRNAAVEAELIVKLKA